MFVVARLQEALELVRVKVVDGDGVRVVGELRAVPLGAEDARVGEHRVGVLEQSPRLFLLPVGRQEGGAAAALGAEKHPPRRVVAGTPARLPARRAVVEVDGDGAALPHALPEHLQNALFAALTAVAAQHLARCVV